MQALSVTTVSGVPWLRGPGRVLLWIAVAVWCAVLAKAARSIEADLRRIRASVRSTAPR